MEDIRALLTIVIIATVKLKAINPPLEVYLATMFLGTTKLLKYILELTTAC